LIRVITPIAGGEPVDEARARALHFTSRMTPYLSQFIPN